MIGSLSITPSSTIATSGCSSLSISPPPPLKLSALTLTAADAAKHSAHVNGTTRHTANARSATRVTQGATGQATIAIGMPTNSRAWRR